MKTNVEPLFPETFYHVYNRGINGENIFKQERNYAYFLQRYAYQIAPIAETYAYCLLKNHFHVLIKTKSESEIKANCLKQKEDAPKSISSTQDRSASWHISNQFAKLFNGYSQAVSKAVGRTGGLFEEPFRRIHVDSDAYFTFMIHYIHFNSQKHGFVDDFRDYPHSSYHSHLSAKTTQLNRNEVLNWFGNRHEYEKFHVMDVDEMKIKALIVEFD